MPRKKCTWMEHEQTISCLFSLKHPRTAQQHNSYLHSTCCARLVRNLEMLRAQEGRAQRTCKSCARLTGDARIQGLGHLRLFERLGICLPESQRRTAFVPVYAQVIVTLMGKYLHHNENDVTTSEKLTVMASPENLVDIQRFLAACT